MPNTINLTLKGKQHQQSNPTPIAVVQKTRKQLTDYSMCPFSKYGQYQSHNKRSKEREREREREYKSEHKS